MNNPSIASYWNGNGKYQAAADALEKLIPGSGACENPRSKNKHLDKFRRASNCYYDLFNNGLCNRKYEFERMFGYLPHKAYHGHLTYPNYNWNREQERLNPLMDQIILDAAKEQNIAL